MSTTETNRPVHHIRLRLSTASIWRNETPDGGVRFDTTLEQLYRDKNGVWAYTKSLSRDSLCEAAEVLRLAALWINSEYERLRQEMATASSSREGALGDDTPAANSTSDIPF
jgi:hypothetical protein